jgi:mannitol/fructose-specific phosphotransferase system IIA component (Ntr-type)
MQLSELFAPDDLLVDFDPSDKWEAMRRLVEHLVARGHVDADAATTIVDAVLARERSMSTGMEHGIAIPHAAVDEVDEVVASLGIVRRGDGLEFDSIDGQPTRLVVLLVIPRPKKLLHIRTLADIARVLGRDEVREGLLGASDAKAAWEVLEQGDAAVR